MPAFPLRSHSAPPIDSSAVTVRIASQRACPPCDLMARVNKSFIVVPLESGSTAAARFPRTGELFDADFDGVDSVRVKRKVSLDCRYGGIRSLVAPDGVDRARPAGRNAVIGALALVGTIRLTRCAL